MIKKITVPLLLLAGCGTVGELYNNMVESNDKLQENIVVLGEVKETVLENSAGVVRSTAEVRHFQKVNAENQKVIINTMNEVHPYDVHKLAGLGLLLLLFLPCVILGVSYFNLPRKK